MITQERLKELFDYQDGQLTWKVKKARANKGDIAGCNAEASGIMYRQTKIDGKQYRVHCLVFLLHHGYLPKQVDHIDGIPRVAVKCVDMRRNTDGVGYRDWETILLS